MKICLIIPTYNEKENIVKLIKQIFDLKINGLEIIVIDDNSPDGSGFMVDQLTKKYPSFNFKKCIITKQ